MSNLESAYVTVLYHDALKYLSQIASMIVSEPEYLDL